MASYRNCDLKTEHRLTRLETMRKEQAKALELQRTQTDRRLDALNGEAERIRQIQERFTTQEATDALSARVKLLEGSQSEYTSRRETQSESRSDVRYWINLAAAIILGVAGIVAATIVKLA